MLKCDARPANRNGQKVAAIKLVRAATGMGLKESKDLVETEEFNLDVNETFFGSSETELSRQLRSIGVIVNAAPMASETTLSMLEDALHEAVSLHTMDLAEDILALLKKWRK